MKIDNGSLLLRFWSEDRGENIEDAEEFEAKNFDCFEDMESNLEAAAESYADHFHANCDGWECSWPIVFSIADSEGKFLGKVCVNREHYPTFSGKLLDEARQV